MPPVTSFSVEEAYNQAAPYYDDWKWQRFWRSHEYPFITNYIRDLAQTRGAPLHLLDVGCGTGAYLHALQDCCSSQIGIDLSAEMLKMAKSREADATLIHGNASAIPCRDKSFDLILCARMLSHIEDLDPVIAEMTRLLKDDGRLIISNIDSSHAYENTKLPLPAAPILVPTYKHCRNDIAERLHAAGLHTNLQTFIGETGIMADENPGVIEWISVFSRHRGA